MIKRVAVTGSNGFIGKFLTKYLADFGFEVYRGTRQNADVTNVKKLERFIKNCDAVVHLAVYQNVFDNSYEKFEEINIKGTKNVLNLCKKYGLKVILFSSEVVFRKSNDFYTRSKKAQLEIAKKYKNVEIVYPPVVLDLNSRLNWWQLMPGGIMAAIGNGNKEINFIEVKDLCKYVKEILELKKVPSLPIKTKNKIEYIKYIHKFTGGLYIPFRIPITFIKIAERIFSGTKYKKLLESIIENE